MKWGWEKLGEGSNVGVLGAALAMVQFSHSTAMSSSSALKASAMHSLEEVDDPTEDVDSDPMENVDTDSDEGGPEPEEGEKRDYGLHPIHGEALEGLGVRLVEGRLFNTFDNESAPPVACPSHQRKP